MKLLISIVTTSALIGSLQAQQAPTRELLPKTVNSDGMEIRPLISGDGQTLFFSRRQHPDNIGGTRDLQDIFVSNRLGANEWSEASNIGNPVNNKNANSACATNSAGTELLLISEYKKLKTPLALARKVGESWSDPEGINIQGFYNISEYIDFHWSPAEDVLLMAIQHEDSKGDQDLYVSKRLADGSWGEAINLGATVNTASADFAPFLAADGRTLFFASYGHRGMGGSDLYYSVRLDDSWTNWSAPKNLGKVINTSGEETYISVTDNLSEIYFASYRQGAEQRDIYHSNVPEGFIESPTFQPSAPQAKNSPEDFIQESVQLAAAEVEEPVDEVAPAVEELVEVEVAPSVEEPVEVEVARETESVPAKEETTEFKTEEVEMVANAAETKDAPQELARTERKPEQPRPAYTLDLQTSIAYEVIKGDNSGSRIIDLLPNIYFDFNAAKIRGQFSNYLQEIQVLLSKQPGMDILLIGHADEVGSKKRNYDMGLKRARAVKEYLQKQGISSNRIRIDSKGETMPLASNDDDREGRELNRRVDVQLLPSQLP